MPRLDMSKPSTIIYMTEMFEKENRLRAQWVQRNSKNMQKYATFQRDLKNYTETDITKATIVNSMSVTRRGYAESMRHRLRAPVPDYMNAKIETTNVEPTMMPVSDKIKPILLDSRKEYLQARAKTAPEDRYRFMESSNWKYGWKFNESEPHLRSTFARVDRTINCLKNRVGPQPDPVYYSSPNVYSHFCFQ